MQTVELYTTPFCGFCHAAKRLLASKGIGFSEIDLSNEPNRRAEMMQRSGGGRTVPQIFVGGRHIGGCNELYDLDRAGRLDPLLAG